MKTDNHDKVIFLIGMFVGVISIIFCLAAIYLNSKTQ